MSVPFVGVTFLLVVAVCQLAQQLEHFCEIANVHIEHEDGSRQVFEIKTIEPNKGTCSFCIGRAVSYVPRLTSLQTKIKLKLGEIFAECESENHKLPVGLCSLENKMNFCNKESSLGCSDISYSQELADEIVHRGLVPMATGDDEVDKNIALGIVLLNQGLDADAIKHFTQILQDHPSTVGALYGRGVTYMRKGLEVEEYAASASADFSRAIELDDGRPEIYERRVEVLIVQGRNEEALNDLNKALQYHSTERLHFLRGLVNINLQNFLAAEGDFSKNLDTEGPLQMVSYFHLGLAQYYRGRVRNAIEVFKDVLKQKPDYIDVCTSLGQAFSELGNIKAAKTRFNQSLNIDNRHVFTRQLRGRMFYYNGDTHNALKDFRYCLVVDPANTICQYMQSLSFVSMGKFYNGVKAATKVMINRPMTSMKMTPEFLKAHYLREYARYLHSQLDQPVTNLKVDEHLQDTFRDHWVKLLPFSFKAPYKEQPGLQPDIIDVTPLRFSEYEKDSQTLICQAKKIGWSMQVNADGFLPNQRLNLAMGLAAVHIAQHLEIIWKGIKQNKATEKFSSWRDMFSLAVQYRRLVDPEQPVLWVNMLPDHNTKEGYITEFNFIRGSVVNMKMLPYFDLVFKLAKTMLEHYTGNGAVVYPELREDIEKAKTYEDLLTVAKKRQISPHGFMIATQVPSSVKNKQMTRHDGVLLTLTEDMKEKVVFSINVISSESRTNSYHTELEHLFTLLREEIKNTGVNRISDVDSVLNVVLTLVYYFYNLMPLSRGTSVVAYTVALGLIMSVGRQVTGKIPSGKLLDLEAMLSGAPDAFILVTKQWMNIKRISAPVSGLPKVWEVFPTVRSLLEVLSLDLQC